MTGEQGEGKFPLGAHRGEEWGLGGVSPGDGGAGSAHKVEVRNLFIRCSQSRADFFPPPNGSRTSLSAARPPFKSAGIEMKPTPSA